LLLSLILFGLVPSSYAPSHLQITLSTEHIGARGEELFKSGDHVDNLYLLKSGGVKYAREDRQWRFSLYSFRFVVAMCCEFEEL
jgi:hypothetical protein